MINNAAMTPERAQINRSIRSIRTELEYLHDTSTITTDTLNALFALLPTAESAVPSLPSAPATLTTTTPTAAVTPFSPSSTYSQPTPVSEKLLPLASPAPSQPPPPSYTPTPAQPAQPTVLSRADALWAFTGSEPGDLTFKAGDTIEVVEKVKDDWWRGHVLGAPSGEVGLFPSSYVRETQVFASSKVVPPLPARQQQHAYGGYGAGGNYMTDVAHSNNNAQMQHYGGEQNQVVQQTEEQKKEKSKMQQNGEKFGKKLGNAAVFGAGATIGSKIVNGIF